jgi:hypothetical protein
MGEIRTLPFRDQITRELSTASTVYMTSSDFTTLQLFPSLNSSGRVIRTRSARIQYGPLPEIAASPPTALQIAAVDPVTGAVVPLTRLLIVSETNPRTTAVRLPAEFARWLQDQDAEIVIWRVLVFNLTSSATVVTFPIRLEVAGDLSEPVAMHT